MKNKYLEMVRGFAALLVVLTHLSSKIPELARNKGHLINFFCNWGTEAVIIFFILSGIVIHSSFEKQPRSMVVFLYQRIVRLHPTLLLSILISVVIEYAIYGQIPSHSTIFLNIIPLSSVSGYLSPLLWNTNPVIWSLTFEVFFYFIFGLFVINNKKINNRNAALWFVISLCCIGFYYANLSSAILKHVIQMFAFSSIWITGFYIWKLRELFSTNLLTAIFGVLLLPLISRLRLTENYYDPIKYFLFACTSIPMFLYLTVDKSSKSVKKNAFVIAISFTTIYIVASTSLILDRSYLPVIKIAYILLPFFSLLLTSKLIKRSFSYLLNKIFLPFFVYLGKYSYSIYLFHFPIIVGINVYFTQVSLPIKVSIIFICTLSLSHFMENVIQSFLNKKLLH